MEPLSSKPLGLRPLTRGAKRQLDSQQGCPSTVPEQRQQQQQCAKRPRRSSGVLPHAAYDLSLYVRWHSACGRSRVSRLPLQAIGSVDDLRGLFRRLIRGAFPRSAGGPPEYLTSERYYQFTPAEGLVSLPGDCVRTQFRLVATVDGWEHELAARELGGPPDPEHRLVVTVAEFESDAVVAGGNRVVFSLVSYPTVCVDRPFLDAALASLRGCSGSAGGGTPAPA